jgi:hypothetical protein
MNHCKAVAVAGFLIAVQASPGIISYMFDALEFLYLGLRNSELGEGCK